MQQTLLDGRPRRVEPGVTIRPAPAGNQWSLKGSDVTTYNLRKMSVEAIHRYGLDKYVK